MARTKKPPIAPHNVPFKLKVIENHSRPLKPTLLITSGDPPLTPRAIRWTKKSFLFPWYIVDVTSRRKLYVHLTNGVPDLISVHPYEGVLVYFRTKRDAQIVIDRFFRSEELKKDALAVVDLFYEKRVP